MTTPMPNGIHVGDRVRGSYLGTPFTGTVHSTRGHTINHRVFMTFVLIDEPINLERIDRWEERGVMVDTAFDGTTLPSSAGSWGDTGDFLEQI